MLQNNLWSKLFKDFIYTLNLYRDSHRTYFLSWFTLCCSKVDFAGKIRTALRAYQDNNEIDPLLELASRIERSNSDFTIPAHMMRSIGFGTPSSESFNVPSRCGSANSEFEIVSPITVQPDIEFYKIFWSYYGKLHGLRGPRPVGRLDALVYAMSRTAFFMDWISQNINVEVPDIILDQNLSGSFIEISFNDTNTLYKDAICLITYYLSCLCFDRALVRFAALRQVDSTYYLNTGIYEAMIINKQPLTVIDEKRDSLIRYLILLYNAYLEPEGEERDFILKYLLIGDEISKNEMLLPLISSLLPESSRFATDFNALFERAKVLSHLATRTSDAESELEILERPTADFIDHDEEIPFATPAIFHAATVVPSPRIGRSVNICPSPLPPRTPITKRLVSSS